MQTENLYEQVAALSNDCIKVLGLDEAVLTINDGGLRALHAPSADVVLGRDWVSMWPERSHLALRRYLQQAKQGHVERFTDQCPTFTGEERWWFVTISPVVDAQGVVTQLLVVSRDVTDRMHMEEALEKINRALSERLEEANDRAEEENKRYQRAVDQLQRTQRYAERLQAGTDDWQTRLSVAETSRRLAEEVARQSQASAAIGQLAAGVAHDLNNMLQTALMSLGALNEKADLSPERRARLVSMSLSAVQRASTTARRMMSCARGRLITTRLHDLQSLVVSMTEFVAHALGPQMSLRVHRQPQPVTAMIDVHAIEQALINLLINARDACQGEGIVEIRFGEHTIPSEDDEAVNHQDFVTVSVTDNGSGMDEATRSRLFEPYFTTKQEGRGTGLGLAQVYGLMLQLGGRVSVESELGKGTTFTLMFCKPDAVNQESPSGDRP